MTRSFPAGGLVSVILVAGLGGCAPSEPGPPPAPADAGTSGFVPDTKPVPQARWQDSTVPRGTVLKLSLLDSLDSGSSRKGDAFRTLVTDAIVIEGSVTVPSGSNVMGEVSEVIPAATGFKGKGGMLRLEFNRIGTPTGASADLKSRLTGLTPPRSSAVLAGSSDPGAVAAGARGREAVLDPNTPLTIVLQEALRLKVRQ